MYTILKQGEAKDLHRKGAKGAAPGNEVDMKGSFLWKLMWLLCALAGILAGYGIFRLSNAQEVKPNTRTKDNTLVQNEEDSVFFDGITTIPAEPLVRKQETEAGDLPPQKTELTDREPSELLPEEEQIPKDRQSKEQGEEMPDESLMSPIATIAPPDHIRTENGAEIEQGSDNEMSGKLPTLSELFSDRGKQWKGSAWLESNKTKDSSLTITEGQELNKEVKEVITYPAEIFGQVPVINRSDKYASYFEFCYDVVNLLESEVKQRGLSMNVLMTKFAVKALFCGVDVKRLDINAPIARKDAALVLWLAAELLEEKGTDTSAKAVVKYVTDISACSNSVKKAVAYLYEQGIMPGYQVAGQRFYPEANLQTESSEGWLFRVKQCWK